MEEGLLTTPVCRCCALPSRHFGRLLHAGGRLQGPRQPILFQVRAGPHDTIATASSSTVRAATPIDLCLGALWPLRWLEGDPRDKFDPVILGSGDSVFTESANVAVNWVRANMQSMTERYGQPKVRQWVESSRRPGAVECLAAMYADSLVVMATCGSTTRRRGASC